MARLINIKGVPLAISVSSIKDIAAVESAVKACKDIVDLFGDDLTPENAVPDRAVINVTGCGGSYDLTPQACRIHYKGFPTIPYDKTSFARENKEGKTICIIVQANPHNQGIYR